MRKSEWAGAVEHFTLALEAGDALAAVMRARCRCVLRAAHPWPEM